MEKVVCIKCGELKDVSDFYKRKNITGRRRDCKVCFNLLTQNGRDIEKRKTYDKEYHLKNKEKILGQKKEWAKNNRDKVSMKNLKSRTKRGLRIPPWLDKYDMIVIKNMYDTSADLTKINDIDFEVDHIVPLNGKMVSGLHVPSNLQILPASVNRSKSNKYMELP